jgi:hypothetical protein
VELLKHISHSANDPLLTRLKKIAGRWFRQRNGVRRSPAIGSRGLRRCVRPEARCDGPQRVDDDVVCCGRSGGRAHRSGSRGEGITGLKVPSVEVSLSEIGLRLNDDVSSSIQALVDAGADDSGNIADRIMKAISQVPVSFLQARVGYFGLGHARGPSFDARHGTATVGLIPQSAELADDRFRRRSPRGAR